MSKKKSYQRHVRQNCCWDLIAKRLITMTSIVLVFSMMYYISCDDKSEQQLTTNVVVDAQRKTSRKQLSTVELLSNYSTEIIYDPSSYYPTDVLTQMEKVSESEVTTEVVSSTENVEEYTSQNDLVTESQEDSLKVAGPETQPISSGPEIIYAFEYTGYVNCGTLNIRKKPNTDSKRLGYLKFNDMVSYSYYNDDWAVIQFNDNLAYISMKYLSESQIPYVSKDVKGDKRKSYMDWRTITSRSSMQYKLQDNYAYTASNGVRAVKGRYLIALGSYYTHQVGQYVDLILENGFVIPCIIGDCKKNKDTTNEYSIGVDGGVAEFVVDTNSLSSVVQFHGDVSYSADGWLSNVAEIRLYDKNVFDD